jgi:hypothetical protein
MGQRGPTALFAMAAWRSTASKRAVRSAQEIFELLDQALVIAKKPWPALRRH